MKKILSIILMVMAIACAAHAKSYIVYSVDGKVTQASTGKAVNRHDQLSESTMLSIPKDGAIQIIDPTSNRIYLYNKSGKKSVASIIAEITKISESSIRSINSQIARAANDDPGSATLRHRRGMSVRGEDEDDEATVATYLGLQHLVAPTNVVSSSSDPLILSALFVDAEAFYFTVTNLTENPLYANILCVSPEGDASLCLNIGNDEGESYLLINPGVCAQLEDYVFLRREQPSQYILFASTVPFDSDMLNQMIQERRIIESDTTASPLLSTSIKM